MKIGQRVSTDYGLGTIVAVENHSRLIGAVGGGKRYGVELDTPIDYSPVYLWANEVEHVHSSG